MELKMINKEKSETYDNFNESYKDSMVRTIS